MNQRWALAPAKARAANSSLEGLFPQPVQPVRQPAHLLREIYRLRNNFLTCAIQRSCNKGTTSVGPIKPIKSASGFSPCKSHCRRSSVEDLFPHPLQPLRNAFRILHPGYRLFPQPVQPPRRPSRALGSKQSSRKVRQDRPVQCRIVVSACEGLAVIAAGVGNCDVSHPPPSAWISVTEAVICWICSSARLC